MGVQPRISADFIRTILLENLPQTIVEDVIAWVRENLSPEDVFDKRTLDEWAAKHGYVIPED